MEWKNFFALFSSSSQLKLLAQEVVRGLMDVKLNGALFAPCKLSISSSKAKTANRISGDV
jgi:hypothetical protein